MFRYVIGVDEAGRGPLAGPVAVGVVKVPVDFDWELIPGVNDSKALSPEKREALFRQAWQLRRKGIIDWSVGMSSSKLIDERGIVYAIDHAMQRALKKIEQDYMVQPNHYHTIDRTIDFLSLKAEVKLDGGLRAPERFQKQETIIKGDAKEPVIGLASILAKVTRDRYMVRIAERFAPYDFSTHKGYGTKAHRAAITAHGLSKEHRASFCRNLLK